MAHKTFLQLGFFLLHLTHLASGFRNAKRRGTELTYPRAEHWDIVKSGQYLIVGCGRGNASTITHLLDALYSALQPAIQDATSSYFHPSAAFKSFFHSPLSAADQVAALLTNITTGASIYPPTINYGLGENSDALAPGSPTFVCVTTPGTLVNDPGVGDYYDFCRENPGVVMDYPGGNQYIAVCPSFFTIGLPPLPPPNNCLTVNSITNRFRGNGAKLSHFQLWVLLEEIAHYYIKAGKGQTTDVSDVNRCAHLGIKKSLGNASNYLYYVASEFPLFVIISGGLGGVS